MLGSLAQGQFKCRIAIEKWIFKFDSYLLTLQTVMEILNNFCMKMTKLSFNKNFLILS